MLQTLHIENIAIIHRMDVEFYRGLNILTGETGAGKSILIDALGLVLGLRADSTLIRFGEKRAVVEAEFSSLPLLPDVRNALKKCDIEYNGGDVLLRRELNSNGKSRAFFNDELIPVSSLRIIGNSLVEMHGQHDNQKLLRQKNHLAYLGKCMEDKQVIHDYRRIYQEFKSLLRRYEELCSYRDSYLKERELREFHFKELDEIKPEHGELPELEKELKVLENSSCLAEASNVIANKLYESEKSHVSGIEDLKKELQSILNVDPTQQEIFRELQSALISLQEIGRAMAAYRDGVPHDPSRLTDLQEKVGAVNYQMRKHQKTYEQLCDYYQELKDEMTGEADYDTRLEKLKNQLDKTRTILSEKAVKFHKSLVQTGDDFAAKIESKLQLLGMSGSRFNIRYSQRESESEDHILFDGKKVEPTVNGIDDVEFLIITNTGESFKPLAKIASGGEISRIMLAVKSVLADHDDVPSLIFDEIDSGISGRIARVVGEQIRLLSKHHQILCITHLPQIASLGDRHYKVDKSTHDNLTFGSLEILDPDARICEIASMVGGTPVSDASMKTASELIRGS